ncbi:methyltransferase-like protein 13 [Hordeum vulgare]|nr:methyltransferase-like protein 13 [Hordeum vulgare]
MSSSSLPLSPRGAEEEGTQGVTALGAAVARCYAEEEGDTRSDGTRSYGEAGYCDARYVEEGGASYGWYQRYAALRPFVRRLVPPASRLLMIGCGSMLMSEDMVADGYMEIINIDISLVLIEMMRKKYFGLFDGK